MPLAPNSIKHRLPGLSRYLTIDQQINSFFYQPKLICEIQSKPAILGTGDSRHAGMGRQRPQGRLSGETSSVQKTWLYVVSNKDRLDGEWEYINLPKCGTSKAMSDSQGSGREQNKKIVYITPCKISRIFRVSSHLQ